MATFASNDPLADTVNWTPEGRFPFFRLTDITRSMPWLAPPGKSLITADIGCEVGDRFWGMADDELGEFCLRHLDPLIREARQRYLGCRVLRTPIAYPIFLNEYEHDRQRFAQSTQVGGLYSIGRNGEFSQIFMEEVYLPTLKKMRQLLADLGQ